MYHFVIKYSCSLQRSHNHRLYISVFVSEKDFGPDSMFSEIPHVMRLHHEQVPFRLTNSIDITKRAGTILFLGRGQTCHSLDWGGGISCPWR